MGAAVELSGQKKILAVDDEQEILHLYDTFLKYKGYTVTTVSSADACLEAMTRDPPDLILLDVNMPGIDGLRLLEMIKMGPVGQDLPIIMISARRDEETVKAAVRLGCDSFIVKPFKLGDLAQRITSELYASADIDPRELFPDALYMRTSIFKEPGLQDFSSLHWDPYPVRRGEHDLCLLIRRGFRPSSLLKAPESELRQKLVVVYRHPVRWKRIWPR